MPPAHPLGHVAGTKWGTVRYLNGELEQETRVKNAWALHHRLERKYERYYTLSRIRSGLKKKNLVLNTRQVRLQPVNKTQMDEVCWRLPEILLV